MVIKFNNNHILRIEYFGSILINQNNKKIFELNKENTLYLLFFCYYDKEYAKNNENYIYIKEKFEKLEKYINEKDLKILNFKNIEKEILLKEIEYIWNNYNHLSFPLQIALYPTMKCNLKCKFCYMVDKINKKENDNIENFLNIINKSIDYGVCSFSILGGEPFLYKNILKILKEIEKKEINASITTNGTFFSDKQIEFLKNSKYVTPVISIQTLNFKNRDLTGVDYKVVLKNINRLKNNGIKFNINTVYTIQTYEEIIEMINLFSSIGVKKYSLAVFVDNNCNEKYNLKTFIQIRKIRENIEKYIFDNKLNIFFTVEGCMMYFGYPEYKTKNINLTEFEKLEYGCEVGQTKLEILNNGVISVCSLHKHFDNKKNNVFKDDIKDIWLNNKDLKYYRNLSTNAKECKNCNINIICNGGCPAYRIKKLKNYNITNERDDRCFY